MNLSTPDPERGQLQTAVMAVFVPGSQAVITGILSGLSATVLADVANLPHVGTIGLATGLVVSTAAWVALVKRWVRVAWRIEELTGQDIDQDGYIGQPEPAPIVRLELKEGNATRFIDLPATPEQLAVLAAGLVSGLPLGENHWTGESKPFSKSQFHALRDELLRRGLAEWVNPDARPQGVRLTGAGRAVIRRLAGLSPTPHTNYSQLSQERSYASESVRASEELPWRTP